MAVLTVQDIDLDGLKDHTYESAASGGDSVPNDGNTLIKLRNVAGSSNPITVTINSQRACNYGYDHDIAIAIDYGEEVVAGPFDRTRFNNANGSLELTYSAVTDLEVAALHQSVL